MTTTNAITVNATTTIVQVVKCGAVVHAVAVRDVDGEFLWSSFRGRALREYVSGSASLSEACAQIRKHFDSQTHI